MCGPAIQGDVAAPMVDRLIMARGRGREQYADVFCLALLSIAKCRSWAAPAALRPRRLARARSTSTSTTTTRRATARPLTSRRRASAQAASVVDAAAFKRTSAGRRRRPAVRRYGAVEGFRALAMLQIDRDWPRAAPLGCRRVHGRVEALVGVGVPRALGEALGKGHGGDEARPRGVHARGAERRQPARVEIAFARRRRGRIARSRGPSSSRRGISPSAARWTSTRPKRTLDAGDALCSIAHFAAAARRSAGPSPAETGLPRGDARRGRRRGLRRCFPTHHREGRRGGCVELRHGAPRRATRVAAAGGIPELVAVLVRDELRSRRPGPGRARDLPRRGARGRRAAGSDVREAGAQARADGSRRGRHRREAGRRSGRDGLRERHPRDLGTRAPRGDALSNCAALTARARRWRAGPTTAASPTTTTWI